MINIYRARVGLFSENYRTSSYSNKKNIRFLANVNSCSCSVYVVVHPSVVCL